MVIEKDRARKWAVALKSLAPTIPVPASASVELKHERVAYWRGVGAQLSSTVAKLVAKNPAPRLQLLRLGLAPVADAAAA